MTPAEDLTEMPQNGWLIAWHPPGPPPEGRPHGASGVCVSDAAELALISSDGEHWGLPGGRPEGTETWRETLDREMWEEACVRVLDARLLGYARGRCLAGPEEGLVLVRSFWWARVAVEPWEPRFEIPHRRLVPVAGAETEIREIDDVAERITLRAIREAGTARTSRH